jgi:hypothetical protein
MSPLKLLTLIQIATDLQINGDCIERKRPNCRQQSEINGKFPNRNSKAQWRFERADVLYTEWVQRA